MTNEVLLYTVNEPMLWDADGKMTLVPGGFYSGQRPWRDICAHERRIGEGPIPRGRWKLGQPYHSAKTGPLSIPLSPLPGTETYGRSAFLIHGDNKEGDASEGCIVAPRSVRANLATALAAGRGFVLYVVPNLRSVL